LFIFYFDFFFILAEKYNYTKRRGREERGLAGLTAAGIVSFNAKLDSLTCMGMVFRVVYFCLSADFLVGNI
jgi:hypothetical protein